MSTKNQIIAFTFYGFAVFLIILLICWLRYKQYITFGSNSNNNNYELRPITPLRHHDRNISLEQSDDLFRLNNQTTPKLSFLERVHLKKRETKELGKFLEDKNAREGVVLRVRFYLYFFSFFLILSDCYIILSDNLISSYLVVSTYDNSRTMHVTVHDIMHSASRIPHAY